MLAVDSVVQLAHLFRRNLSRQFSQRLAHRRVTRQGLLAGVEPSGQNLVYVPEKAKKAINDIIEASKNTDELERRSLLKRHIKNIIYSKEAIEVHIKYPLSDKGLPVAGQNVAALFWTAAKKRRRQPPLKAKTADFLDSAVRLEKLVAPRGFEPRRSA